MEMLKGLDRRQAITMYRTRTHSMDLHSSETMVHSLNSEGIIIDVSPGWLKATGYERQEVIGRFFGEFLLEESLSTTKREFPHLKDYGFVDNVRLKLKRRDGVALEIVLNGTSKYGEDGTFERTYCEWRSLDYFIQSTERISQLLIHEKFFRMVGHVKSHITALLLKNDISNCYADLSKILNEPSEIVQALIEPDAESAEEVDENTKSTFRQAKALMAKQAFTGKVLITRSQENNDEYTLLLRVQDELMPTGERIIWIDFVSPEDLLADWEDEFFDITILIESVIQMIKVNSEVKRLVAELKIASETDALTGIYNRLMLDRILLKQVGLFSRKSEKFSVIMMDIDHFKNINDTYGHNRGDKVLCSIANILKIGTRGSDTVGRWGGEEFLIICENTASAGAIVLAQNLRAKIADQTFEGDIRVTCSFGVSEFAEGMTIEQVISLADAGLYKAKHAGRNGVGTV